MPAISLTPREVAEIAHVPHRSVEKAIEEKVLAVHSRATPLSHGRSERRFLGLESVAYVRLMRGLSKDLSLTVAAKRRLARTLKAVETPNWRSVPVEIAPSVLVDVATAVGDAIDRAERYARARAKWIDSVPGIKGGAPVIRGTRVTAHSLAARIDGGDSVDDLVEENPDLPREAIETAITFAKAHPLVGRPAKPTV